jgi:hypothetical protein
MTARLLRLTRTTILAVLACVALVAGGTAAVAATTAGTTGATEIQITGTVSDRGGYPLEGMIVQVVRADHEESDFAETRTYVGGKFGTPKIPVDSTMNYLLEVTDPTGRHQKAYSKEFAATAANRKQNVTMADAAVIRGKVTTKDGDVVRPATSIFVEAQGTDSGGRPAGGFTFTSSKGAFSMGGLPSGTYSLTFLDYDEENTREGPLFQTICYDNVPLTAVEPDRCDGATLVKVTAGKVTTINPQVLDHKLGSISGTATDTNGAPLKGKAVTIVAANDQNVHLGERNTKADGSWSVPGIRFVGKVKVSVSDPFEVYRTTWYTNAVDFAHATALQLKDQGEINGITFVMPPS